MAENDSPEIIVVRQQERGHDGKFYFHPNNEYGFYFSATSVGSSKIGTLPAGKKFKLRTVIVHNASVQPVTVILTNGSSLSYTKMRFALGTAVSKELTGIKGIVFDDDPYLQLDTFASALDITLGGELDPDEDAA
jgi:endoglucanase Acf2